MLISDMFRGMDSTGCFAVNKHGNLKSIKDTSAPPFFINKKEASSFFDKFTSDHQIVVGHNRKATMGNIISDNAHPFIEGSICLVHNGTLTGHHKLADRVVDSNAVAAHINEFGYKSLLKKIDGAYALIWYNAEERMLYFCRNSERPLFLVETTTNLYLASENKMLDWILDRNEIGKYTIQNVPTDKVFKFSLDTRTLAAESKPKKEQTPSQHQYLKYYGQNNSGSYNKTSGSLALVHSSETTTQQASIETYSSGETVSWKICDFEDRESSVKLIGETCDKLHTTAQMFLSKDQWTQDGIDELLRKEYVTGVITAVSSKHGVVQLWLKNITIAPLWQTVNLVSVTPGQLSEDYQILTKLLWVLSKIKR